MITEMCCSAFVSTGLLDPHIVREGETVHSVCGALDINYEIMKCRYVTVNSPYVCTGIFKVNKKNCIVCKNVIGKRYQEKQGLCLRLENR